METKFSRPSFLWLWQWFTLEGEISHIHLPFSYRLEIPGILGSLIPSKDICLEYDFGSDGYYLFEADSNYVYFGVKQFEDLKSFLNK